MLKSRIKYLGNSKEFLGYPIGYIYIEFLIQYFF